MPLQTSPAESPTAASAASAHPADSSQIFLLLLNLAQRARSGEGAEHQSSLVSPVVLRSLLSSLHFRDKSTLYHVRRVAVISAGVAGELGWSDTEIPALELASLLHDTGKLSVPDSILGKPARLSADELEFVATNHRIGLTLLQAFGVHRDVIEIIARMNDVGDAEAPSVARGAINTALGARILAVADMYDSLIHDQVFRRHLEPKAALQALQQSERQLDRNVIAALRRWLFDGGSALLEDDRSARQSIDANAPVDRTTIAEASSLCHACAYLYFLETLYSGFYVVDAEMRVVISSLGLRDLLRGGMPAVGTPWSRKLIGGVDDLGRSLPDHAYPMHRILQSNHPECSVVKVPCEAGGRAEVELHAIPLLDAEGAFCGAAEILRNASTSKANPALFKELRQAASRDPLTGVANRGELERRLRDLCADFAVHGAAEPFSIIFVDIDHFKRINDTYEHSTGDRVLMNVTQLMESELYSGELVGRYGGEEFLIICPGTDLDHAVKRAERVRRAIQGARLAENVPHLEVTASFGVAEVSPDDTARSLLQRADQALFEAKRSGRNRTCRRDVGDPGWEDTRPESDDEPQRLEDYKRGARIIVCEAADIIVYKLKGFVEDQNARLLDVSRKRVVMHIGRKPLWGKWGAKAPGQPVQVEFSIGEEETTRRSASRRIAVDVVITPIGRPPTPDVFHLRASRVVEHVRSYLLAD